MQTYPFVPQHDLNCRIGQKCWTQRRHAVWTDLEGFLLAGAHVCTPRALQQQVSLQGVAWCLQVVLQA